MICPFTLTSKNEIFSQIGDEIVAKMSKMHAAMQQKRPGSAAEGIRGIINFVGDQVLEPFVYICLFGSPSVTSG